MLWPQPELPRGQLDSLCSFLWALDQAFHLIFFPTEGCGLLVHKKVEKGTHELGLGAERTWDPMRITLTLFILSFPLNRGNPI